MYGGDVDLFTVYRTTLFVFLTVYALLAGLSAASRLIAFFSGQDRPKRMLRLYVSYHLLTIPVRPLGGELLQIAFWLLALAGLWWLHTLVQ